MMGLWWKLKRGLVHAGDRIGETKVPGGEGQRETTRGESTVEERERLKIDHIARERERFTRGEREAVCEARDRFSHNQPALANTRKHAIPCTWRRVLVFMKAEPTLSVPGLHWAIQQPKRAVCFEENSRQECFVKDGLFKIKNPETRFPQNK